MDLSIIIPCYNVGNYIGKCLESVFKLNLSYEIILVNDGSTDHTAEIIHNFLNRYSGIIKVKNQSNYGQSKARNVGMSMAEGEYLAFLDGDDYVNGNMLEKLVRMAGKDEVDIGFGDYVKRINGKYIPQKSVTIRHRKLKKCIDTMSGLEYAETAFNKWNDYLSTEVCFCVFKRNFVEKEKLSFMEGIYHEDTLFFYQSIARAKKVRLYNILFYSYNIHGGTTTTSNELALKRTRDLAVVARELIDLKRKYDIQTYFMDSCIIDLIYRTRTILGRKSKFYCLRDCVKLTIRARIKYILLKIEGII